jgi:hypothetical protein
MYSEYKQPFLSFNENEESRASFTRNTILNLIKYFNSFYSNKEANLLEVSMPFSLFLIPRTLKTNLKNLMKKWEHQQLTVLSLLHLEI